MIAKLSYSIEKYPFGRMVGDLFKVYYLENIDLRIERGYNWEQLKSDKDFLSCYNQFLKDIIQPLFNEKIIVQRFPNLKIQVPGKKSVERYHTDNEYGHDLNEFNIWLPLTNASGTNSIYIESEPGKGDYASQDVNYGEFLMFPGSKLSHGNEINATNESRVSLDFRVIQESLFKKSDLMTIDNGKEVSYFTELL